MNKLVLKASITSDSPKIATSLRGISPTINSTIDGMTVVKDTTWGAIKGDIEDQEDLQFQMGTIKKAVDSKLDDDDIVELSNMEIEEILKGVL